MRAGLFEYARILLASPGRGKKNMQMASCILLQSLCFYAICLSFDRAKDRRGDDDLKRGWEKFARLFIFCLTNHNIL